MSKCKHKWVDMEDGTDDRFCVKCRKFAMQAVAKLPKDLTVAPSSIGRAVKSAQSAEFSVAFENIYKLLKEEIEKDMMKATRSRGVF